MKRRTLLTHLRKYGCLLFREGKRHSIYYHPENERTSSVPRHNEIDDFLANKICRDLSIPKIKK